MKCIVCHKEIQEKELVHGYVVRPAIAKLIRQDYPRWNDESYICKEDLRQYRIHYLTSLLRAKGTKVHGAEEKVVKAIADNKFITADINLVEEDKLTFGEKLADTVARFGGSWKFIILFVIILLVWITINAVALFQKPFDPYPFILLNLILSCLAALQAPVIMMSQNRQEAKDRQRGEDDYKVNLKSELEIKLLGEKVDHLLLDQREILEKMIQLHESTLKIIQEEKITLRKNKGEKANSDIAPSPSSPTTANL